MVTLNGWHSHINTPMDKGKHMNFKEYCNATGVRSPFKLHSSTLKAEAERAEKELAKAKGMRWSTAPPPPVNKPKKGDQPLPEIEMEVIDQHAKFNVRAKPTGPNPNRVKKK